MFQKRKITIYFLAAFSWLILVFVLLILPGSALPRQNWLTLVHADKWVHVGLFAILVFLWSSFFQALKKGNTTLKKIFLLICVTGICFGIVMELIQEYYVLHRSFEWADILADAGGCVAGWLFSIRVHKK